MPTGKSQATAGGRGWAANEAPSPSSTVQTKDLNHHLASRPGYPWRRAGTGICGVYHSAGPKEEWTSSMAVAEEKSFVDGQERLLCGPQYFSVYERASSAESVPVEVSRASRRPASKPILSSSDSGSLFVLAFR